jgi:glucose-6-phosphate-specific signal transduction histidine kinase
MIRRQMPYELQTAIDKVIEHIDTQISIDLTHMELRAMASEYNNKTSIQALAIVHGAVKRLLHTTYNHSLEDVFFDPIYWKFFSKARRADIIAQLREYVEDLP